MIADIHDVLLVDGGRGAISLRLMHHNRRSPSLDNVYRNIECSTQSEYFRLAAPRCSVAHCRAIPLKLLAGHETWISRTSRVLANFRRQEGQEVL